MLRFPTHLRSARSLLVCAWILFFCSHIQAQQTRIPDAPAPGSPATAAVQKNNFLTETSNSKKEILAAQTFSHAGTISLYTVVDLALRNSKRVQMAIADQQRARSSLAETKDVYIPNVSVGSGLGPPSYGFPLGFPTLFNINSTSFVFSFSQRDYIRSANASWKAATLSLQDVRQHVMLDTALDYIGLNATLEQIEALQQAGSDASQMIAVVNDRMQAGLESRMSLTRAQLTEAQIQLRILQLQDHAEELRTRLADATGLAPELLVPAASSIPPVPDLDFSSLMRKERESLSIQAARATADSKLFQYFGDKRQNYRPTVGFGFQYARFASFAGYQQYYPTFQYNNVQAGVQMTWPIFDAVRRDKALESKAEAEHARSQAELGRIESNEANLALWHSLQEMEAQEQVADLQQLLAKDTLATTITEMNNGSADANSAPVPPQQAEQQRIDERTGYVDLQDAQFNVTKVKLNLLRAVGELEDWLKQSDGANAHP